MCRIYDTVGRIENASKYVREVYDNALENVSSNTTP